MYIYITICIINVSILNTIAYCFNVSYKSSFSDGIWRDDKKCAKLKSFLYYKSIFSRIKDIF
jgi:hypothetical protein